MREPYDFQIQYAVDTLVLFTRNLSYIAMLAFVIIAALNQLGIQTASLIVVLGAAGLAVGLALQGSLGNFAAGVLMIIFKPFRLGDYIEGAGTAGIVEKKVKKHFDAQGISIPFPQRDVHLYEHKTSG